jgi:small-conductance mechanosensitive channel
MASVSVSSKTLQPPALNRDSFSNLGERITLYQQMVRDWLVGNATELLLAAVAGFALYVLISWIKRRAVKAVRERSNDPSVGTIALRAISQTSRFFRIMLAVQLVNSYSNAPAPLAKTLFILFTVSAVIQFAVWLREIILSMIERRAQQSGSEHDTLDSAMALIRLAVSFIVFAIAAVVILSNLGVNVTGIVAGLGVGGIAIGLAAQGIFSDLFAAIAIIFDQPFKRGDVIQYDTSTATVERIGMKSTRLRALSGEAKVISNSKLLEKEITNMTDLHFRRTTFVLGLVYQTPAEKLRALPVQLEELVNAHGGQFVRSGFVGFGPSSIDVQLVFDVKTTDFNEVFVGRHQIGLAIIEHFAREKIAFAYPTQTTFTAAPDGEMVMPYASYPPPPPGNSAASKARRTK